MFDMGEFDPARDEEAGIDGFNARLRLTTTANRPPAVNVNAAPHQIPIIAAQPQPAENHKIPIAVPLHPLTPHPTFLLAMSPAEFANSVVTRLRSAGFEALLAGGCVRDQLLGIPPKDYDVATSAVPEQIRDLFGRRKTLAVGASFGVITVIGPQDVGQIDVATFRRDAAYSDGRHPDSVSFTNAEEDALRRDFTINGLFFDPLAGRVIDYVGGQEDLRRGIVRAIGDPAQRIAEDKLRMVRGVRFAARFGFALDEPTRAAIQASAGELVICSAERIAAELRRILSHDSRARGVQLLESTGLLAVMLPEVASLDPDAGWSPESTADTPWRRTLHLLDRLVEPTFAVALAALVREMFTADGAASVISSALPHELPRRLFERWKLSTHELEEMDQVLRDEPLLRRARSLPWPRVQRVLAGPRIESTLCLAQGVADVVGEGSDDLAFCRDVLSRPKTEWNPPPLITGDDLKQLAIRPGPAYRTLLETVRDAQLEAQIHSREEAVQLALELHHRTGGSP
jgi:poly(A) polymerase